MNAAPVTVASLDLRGRSETPLAYRTKPERRALCAGDDPTIAGLLPHRRGICEPSSSVRRPARPGRNPLGQIEALNLETGLISVAINMERNERLAQPARILPRSLPPVSRMHDRPRHVHRAGYRTRCRAEIDDRPEIGHPEATEQRRRKTAWQDDTSADHARGQAGRIIVAHPRTIESSCARG